MNSASKITNPPPPPENGNFSSGLDLENFSLDFENYEPPPPRRWKFQFRSGLRKFQFVFWKLRTPPPLRNGNFRSGFWELVNGRTTLSPDRGRLVFIVSAVVQRKLFEFNEPHAIMTLYTFYDVLICISGLVAWIGQISHTLTYSYFPYDVKLNGIFHLWKRFSVRTCLPINLNWFLVPCHNAPYFQIDSSHNMSSDSIENVSKGVYQFWFDKIFSMSIMEQGE